MKNRFLGRLCLIVFIILAGCGGGGGSAQNPVVPVIPPGKVFGGTGNDYGWSVQQNSDGGYVIAGFTNSQGAGNYDAYLLKTDATGTVIKQTTFGGTGNDLCYSIRLTQDGGFIAVGVRGVVSASTSTFIDPAFPVDLGGEIFLRKMNADLGLEWEQTTTLTAGLPYTRDGVTTSELEAFKWFANIGASLNKIIEMKVKASDAKSLLELKQVIESARDEVMQTWRGTA